MFGTHRTAARAYANIGMETGVIAASPHQLITMLFDGAMAAILKAKNHLQDNQPAEKGEAISKAIMIIDSGLRGGLNLDKGGNLAETLDALYSFMVQRLMEANLRNDPALLKEVYGLLNDLKSAWVGMADQN